MLETKFQVFLKMKTKETFLIVTKVKFY